MKHWYIDSDLAKKAMKEKGLTIMTLAEKTYIHYSTITKLLYGWYPSVPISTTKRRIAKALGLPVEDLFPISEKYEVHP